MASGVRLLLRLPPAIRQQLVSAQTTWSICRSNQHTRLGPIDFHQARSFTPSLHLAKNHQGVFKNAQPQKPTPQAHNLPKPVSPARKFQPGSAPPAPDALSPSPSKRPSPRPSYSDWISTRFPNTDRVLLYVAPDHKGFTACAIVWGIVFLVGAYNYAQTFLTDEKDKPAKPWYIKALGAVPTLAFAILGTFFLLAPKKLIKSVTLVKAADASTVAQSSKLRLEIKRIIGKPDTLEVSPNSVVLDRNLPQSVPTINFTNYHIKDAGRFTEYYFSGQLTQKQDSALKRFNQSFLNLWPATVKNTKRMFLRDQMAYVRVPGNGNFKLDLQDSHLLDGANVLARVTKSDVSMDKGLPALIRRFST